MKSSTAYRVLAVVLLGAMGAHRLVTVHTPPDVRRYHERIRVSAASLPRHVGPWVGEDVPVPAQALEVLAPNAIVSRRYVNVETGVSAGFLFVHCADAHDMAGHFPARCYPAAGWDLKGWHERDWVVGDLRVAGIEYEFTKLSLGAPGRDGTVVVANCLLRPGGRVLRNMDDMTRSVVGAGGQSAGAAQLQVYFDASVPRDQRDAAVEALVRGHRDVIDAVLSNPT